MPEPQDAGDKSPGLWTGVRQVMRAPGMRYSLLTLVAGGFLAGMAATIGFDFALHATSTNEFCIGCHANDAAKEWQQSKHHNNHGGIIAGCSDCHLPQEFVPKIVRKVKAAREVWGHFTGVIDTAEKFEAHRLAMAESEWGRMRANSAQECRNCHHPDSMADTLKPYLKDMHKDALSGGRICIDCHKGVAHKAPG